MKTAFISLIFFFSSAIAETCVTPADPFFSVVTATGLRVEWVNGCNNNGGTGLDISIFRTDPSAWPRDPNWYYAVNAIDENVEFFPTRYQLLNMLEPNSTMRVEIFLAPHSKIYPVPPLISASTTTPPIIPSLKATNSILKPSFSQVSSESLIVSWDDGSYFFPANDNPYFIHNPFDTKYRLQASKTAGDFSSPVVDTLDVGVDKTVTCLDPSTTYYFRVQAVGRTGLTSDFLDLGSTRTLAAQTPDLNWVWNNGKWGAAFSPNTLSIHDTVRFSPDPVTDPLGSRSLPEIIQRANEKILSGGDARRLPIQMAEIRLESGCPKEGTPPSLQPVEINARFSPINGQIPTDSGPLRADTLHLYRLDETNALWVRVPTTERTSNDTRTATVTSLGVFGLFGNRDDSLDEVFAFPTPFSRTRGDVEITFVNVSEQATLKIFTAAGALVRTLEKNDSDGRMKWDTLNTSGEPVAPGVYLYLLESPSDKRKGRLMIQP